MHNMQNKYAQNKQIMQKICKKIATNMHNMQKKYAEYATNIQKYTK